MKPLHSPCRCRVQAPVIVVTGSAREQSIVPIFDRKRLFTLENVRAASDQSGVYGLYDANEFPIFFGSTPKNLRGRLNDHLSGREGQCTGAAIYYNTEVKSDPMARQSELLEQHRQRFGNYPKGNE